MAEFGSGWEKSSIALMKEHWEQLAPGVERFRLPGNEPVRRIITGRRNNRVGALYSWKNQGHVVHESGGEERLGRLMEVHPSVTQYFGQPETLRISFDETAGIIHYTPDFLVVMGNAELRIEYKRLVDIRPPKPAAHDERALRRYAKAALMRRRLRLVKQAYDRCQIAWDLYTDSDLAGMGDQEVIDEIIANCGRPISDPDLRRLIDHLQASPDRTATLQECQALLTDSEFPRGDVLARIPERIIEVDLFEPIGEDTIVRLTGARP